MQELNETEINNQIYEAIEKGDLSTLKLLLEPPYSVDMIVRFIF